MPKPLDIVKCPVCDTDWPYLSDHAVCIEQHHECMMCRYGPLGRPFDTLEQMLEDLEVKDIIAGRLAREQELGGKRIFPCPFCQGQPTLRPTCGGCHGHGVMVGTTPEGAEPSV